jgi:hypothetical protein
VDQQFATFHRPTANNTPQDLLQRSSLPVHV